MTLKNLKSPRLKSPKSLLHSPTYLDPNLNQLFIKSPKTSNLEDTLTINDDQVIDEVVDIIKSEEKHIWLTGLLYLLGLVITWIFAVQIFNLIMKKSDFDHPFLISYINGSFFLVFGIKNLISSLKNYIKSVWFNGRIKSASNLNLNNHPYGTVNDNETDNTEDDIIIVETPIIKLSYKQIIIVAMKASLLYYLNCVTGTMALKYTSASNQTILATTSSFFSLVVGVFVKIEKFTIGKLVSILCSILGIFLITLSSTSSFSFSIYELDQNFIGNLLAVFGAFCYSCFLIILRLNLGEETNPECDKLVYGYLGLSTLIFGLPILFTADKLGLEKFQLPDSNSIILLVLLASFLSALSDYCGSVASLLISPLIASLSLSTAIPISMICDSIFYKSLNISIWYFLGIILIFSSFIFTNISNENETLENAIEVAIEEAINHDELLSPLLSPYNHHINKNSANVINEIPGLSINEDVESIKDQQLVITGGHNHKYFIRDINA